MHGSLPENPNLAIDYTGIPLHTLYVAGGCFWGVEAYMARLPGVAQTRVGYANGNLPNPTYEQVCTGTTRHAEAVLLRYDERRVSINELLDAFFSIIDPVSKNRQGNDVGNQYRSGVYYVDEADRAAIERVFAEQAKKHASPLEVELLQLACFYEAEEYHQKYLEKNPNGYCHVRFDSLNK